MNDNNNHCDRNLSPLSPFKQYYGDLGELQKNADNYESSVENNLGSMIPSPTVRTAQSIPRSVNPKRPFKMKIVKTIDKESESDYDEEVGQHD